MTVMQPEELSPEPVGNEPVAKIVIPEAGNCMVHVIYYDVS